MSDAVNHPAHYTAHASQIECVDIAEHLSFNLGNCVKYLWRHQAKGRPLEDLKKALWYARRELGRLTARPYECRQIPGDVRRRIGRVVEAEPVGVLRSVLLVLHQNSIKPTVLGELAWVIDLEVARVELLGDDEPVPATLPGAR